MPSAASVARNADAPVTLVLSGAPSRRASQLPSLLRQRRSRNPPLKKLKGAALYWAEKSLALDLEKEDRADEDTFNRILWHATRGYDTPYPAEFVGRRSPSRLHLDMD